LETTLVDDFNISRFDEAQVVSYYDFVSVKGHSVLTDFGKDYVPIYRSMRFNENFLLN
jgi:hypothetical protein